MGSSSSRKKAEPTASRKKAEATAELNTIYSLSEEEQEAKIMEIIQNYFKKAEDLTENDFTVWNDLINVIDNHITYGNEIGKNQYKKFYEEIALSLIQGKGLNKILTKLVDLDGACFTTIMEKMLHELGIEFKYQTKSNLIKPYKRELKAFIIKNFLDHGKMSILYILFKLGLRFHKYEIQAAQQSAKARYLQYVE